MSVRLDRVEWWERIMLLETNLVMFVRKKMLSSFIVCLYILDKDFTEDSGFVCHLGARNMVPHRIEKKHLFREFFFFLSKVQLISWRLWCPEPGCDVFSCVKMKKEKEKAAMKFISGILFLRMGLCQLSSQGNEKMLFTLHNLLCYTYVYISFWKASNMSSLF